MITVISHVNFFCRVTPNYQKNNLNPSTTFQRSSERGSRTLLQLVGEDKAALVSGAIYSECEVAKVENPIVESMADTTAKELWTFSEKLTGVKY